MNSKIEKLHQKACDLGQEHYTDPETGYLVFTEIFHKKRGQCCQSGCRHCPWDFSQKTKNIKSDSNDSKN